LTPRPPPQNNTNPLQHPLIGATKRKWTPEEQKLAYKEYLEAMLLCSPCKSSNEGVGNRCCCLQELGVDNPRIEDVVLFLCEFGSLKQQ
jgi:hypothetical protein